MHSHIFHIITKTFRFQFSKTKELNQKIQIKNKIIESKDQDIKAIGRQRELTKRDLKKTIDGKEKLFNAWVQVRLRSPSLSGSVSWH